MRALLILSIAVVLASAHNDVFAPKKANGKFVLANYFANWAQYRPGSFSYGPDQLKPAMSMFDYVVYAFGWMNGGCDGCTGSTVYDYVGQCQFSNGTCTWYSDGDRSNPVCPAGSTPCKAGNFTIVSPEPADPQFYRQIIAMKTAGQKVTLSIGGWNFPSSAFSIMVATPEYRRSFIQSAMDVMNKYGFDGIDVDWEFWCSSPRMNNIKISNTTFHQVYDVGGRCPDDGKNLLTLMQEMRQAFGPDKVITLATQADLGKMASVDIAEVSKYIDYWHLMDYDYSVSDLPEKCGDSPCFANFTAPNQPLFAVAHGQIPAHDPPFPSSYWSVNYTVQGYIARGAPKNKLVVGLTYYGHHWYTPGQRDWKRFGVPAKISGKCNGPFAQTYGAWDGHRASLCGLLLYSEIVSLIDENDPESNWFDPVTKSNVGYIKDGSRAGEDLSGSTPSLVCWNSIQSLNAIASHAMELGLAGVFAFDASMDIFDGGKYPVTSAIYATLNNGTQNICDPTRGCNVCDSCCKSYIQGQAACDECVKQECKKDGSISFV